MPKIVSILLFLIVSLHVEARIFPVECGKLTYRIIGFSFPEKSKTLRYTVEIASGSFYSEDSFLRNKISETASKYNRIIAEVPSFGKNYTWRVIYTGKKNNITTSEWHHFSVQMNDRVDTNKLRLRILTRPESHQNDYVAVDAGGIIYDLYGRPVWYMPETEGISGYVADLQLTPAGTFTFIYKNAYEMNYNGDILWRSPLKASVSGDSTGERFHHEFKKLSNGHYMILGMQTPLCKLESAKDSSYMLFSNDTADNRKGYLPGRFGTIIEYDQNGNVVWSWKTAQNLEPDFPYYESRIDSNKRYDPHDNAFYFDEKHKVIYLGYKFLNRIIKIDYPSGKILQTYGQNFKPGATGTGSGIFCNQHSLNFTRDGNLLIFNNNSCLGRDSMPAVMILQEPETPGAPFKKIWEFTCTPEGNYNKIFGNGGNAVELPDQSIFVDMGSECSKLFIVNRDKKILWSALPERFMDPDQKWTAIREYRARIISREDLENLIWQAEK